MELIIACPFNIDLIHDARHLCSPFRIDGIEAMSRGISGGKQVINFANTYEQSRSSGHAKCTVRVTTRFVSLSVFAVRTSTGPTASHHFYP